MYLINILRVKFPVGWSFPPRSITSLIDLCNAPIPFNALTGIQFRACFGWFKPARYSILGDLSTISSLFSYSYSYSNSGRFLQFSPGLLAKWLATLLLLLSLGAGGNGLGSIFQGLYGGIVGCLKGRGPG